MFAGNFAPAGWMFCAGQELAIGEHDALFQLIGTTYGGDGQVTFRLPDLQGRLPIHMGSGFTLGEAGGVEEVTLNTQQIPAHNHPLMASLNTAGGSAVENSVTGQVGATQIYRESPAAAALSPLAMQGTGGSQPHTNFQPYLCVNFIISMFGIFPPPS
jgi:microcystin-dependent protein